MAVPAHHAKANFDVGKDVGTRQITGLVDGLLDACLSHAADQRLGDVVVPAFAALAHAEIEVVGAAEARLFITRIL